MKQLHGSINLDLAVDVLTNPKSYWSHDVTEAKTFAEQSVKLWTPIMADIRNSSRLIPDETGKYQLYISVQDCYHIINDALATISREGIG